MSGVAGGAGLPMPSPAGVAGSYFQQRNQSQDVGALSASNKPLKNKIQQRKRAAMLSGAGGAGSLHGDAGEAGEFVIDDGQA